MTQFAFLHRPPARKADEPKPDDSSQFGSSDEDAAENENEPCNARDFHHYFPAPDIPDVSVGGCRNM